MSLPVTTAAPVREPKPPKIFDDRGRSLAWVARTLHRLYNLHTQKILDRESLTIAHWYYLRVLDERGDLNQLELSKRVGIAANTAVPALDSLEKRNLVRRTRDPADRRKYFVTITEEGRALIRRAMPDIREMFKQSLQGVSAEEMEVFWKVWDTAITNLSRAAGTDTVLD